MTLPNTLKQVLLLPDLSVYEPLLSYFIYKTIMENTAF